MSKLHLVFGGRVKDPRGLDFDLATIDARPKPCCNGAVRRQVRPASSEITSGREPHGVLCTHGDSAHSRPPPHAR